MMATNMAFAAHSPGLVLFAEDFDTAPNSRAVPAPEIIEPSFTPADLEAARQQAWQAGHAAAAASAEQVDSASVRDAIAAIAASLADARTEAAAVAQQAAAELARLLLDSFAAVLPALSARHGEAELRSLLRTLLPALSQEPSVSIRIHPQHAAMVRQEIERLDPELAANLRIVASDAMQPGDIRVTWRGGQAARDVAAFWAQVAEALAPAGLLSCATTKETEHVE